MSVTTKHPDYVAALPTVKTTRDAVKGDPAIKKGGIKYLPAGFAKTEPDRYEQYKNRSFFLGMTRQAESAMLGMIFKRQANIGEVLPTYLEQTQYNIDGSGQSLDQFCRYGLRDTMETGRFGILVDYPELDRNLTKREQESLGIKPYLAGYCFESIINWKTDTIGGAEKLTLVVLSEEVDISEDEFDHDYEFQYLVLRLRDGVYTQQRYDDASDPITDEYAPRANGSTLDHIPFYLVGTDNNQVDIDQPMLFDLALVNIAHYQTTADHRENLFIHGQLTLGISTEMDAESFKAANPDGIRVGAQKGFYLGENGKFHSVTAPESSSLRVALQDLEQQAIGLGGKLVTRGGQAQTAEAARIDASAEASTLETLVSNFSSAVEYALEDYLLFAGQPDAVTYQLNTEFFDDALSPQMASAIVGLQSVGIIAKRDARSMVRAGKVFIEDGRTDEDIESDVSSELLDQ